MYRRAVVALFALALVKAQAQPTSLWVEVDQDPIEIEEVEKRYTPELVKKLQTAKDEVLLLFTEFTGRAGADLNVFLRNISKFGPEILDELDPGVLDDAPEECRLAFKTKLKKIEYDAHKAATFSSENHHKFFLGHMIVFNMHLNKSEDYIRKCEKGLKDCGSNCETTTRIARWRRLALQELHRINEDLEQSRKAYHDLLTHVHRRFNHLRKHARLRALEAVQKLHICTKES